VTNFEPHEALKLITRDKLTFDKRVVIHRVADPKLSALRVRQARVRLRIFRVLI